MRHGYYYKYDEKDIVHYTYIKYYIKSQQNEFTCYSVIDNNLHLCITWF